MKIFVFKNRIKVLINSPELKSIFSELISKFQNTDIIELDPRNHQWGQFLEEINELMKPYLTKEKYTRY